MREGLTYRGVRRATARLFRKIAREEGRPVDWRAAWNAVQSSPENHGRGYARPATKYVPNEPKPSKYVPHQGTNEAKRRASRAA